MRLVRLGDMTSEVGADVRAALASWGRADSVVGGVALLGARPPGCPRPVDAILVLPRGVVIVVGVDLPDPAMRLEAPLTGQWRTDGWPLVRPDGPVNPAVEAIEASSAIVARLQSERVEPLPVTTVIAVGPYVSQVSQPTADLVRGVRVLHPEPTTLLSAARQLATYERPCTVERARGVLAALVPDAPEQPVADLLTEGFSDAVSADLSIASTTLITKVSDEDRFPPSRPAVEHKGRGVRWLPIAAVALVGLLLIGGIAAAIASGGGEPPASPPTGQSPVNAPKPVPPQPVAIAVDGLDFLPRGELRGNDCATHAVGDLRTWLERNMCDRMIRSRFEVTVDGRRAAVHVVLVLFPDDKSAIEFRKTADTPGAGTVPDAAAEGLPWPDDARPSFDSAAYGSVVQGTGARLALAAWVDQPSTSDDPVLKSLAGRALKMPLAG
ncbi:hypothetical protein EV193_10432 [Herbihabitans rhizosphaerae]|uniref:Uncharacterized protein n=1 Tax=Herbihabitans rhizosphaerae TaxID=1872711 RepID=A0A4V2ESU8_9PSEU|nr:hypothetical protein [Herbihabitans rhizosphaerae]RZS38823.1 hypothetical protein EV193_10432 [Herbihabitans rhizosphaerae]